MKVLKGILITLFVIIIVATAFFFVDQARFKKEQKPLFAIKTISKDGNKVTYYGLFYKVVAYPGVSPKEKFKTMNNKKMLFWCQDYKKKDLSDKTEDAKEAVIKSTKDFYKYLEDKKMDIEKEIEDFDEKEAKDKDYYVYQKDEEINRSKLDDFLDKVEDKKTALLKVATPTIEGDFILYHILYDAAGKKVYVVADTTRDKHASKDIRRIELYTLDKIEVRKNDDGKKQLVAYEGDKYMPEASFKRSAMLTRVK